MFQLQRSINSSPHLQLLHQKQLLLSRLPKIFKPLCQPISEPIIASKADKRQKQHQKQYVRLKKFMKEQKDRSLNRKSNGNNRYKTKTEQNENNETYETYLQRKNSCHLLFVPHGSMAPHFDSRKQACSFDLKNRIFQNKNKNWAYSRNQSPQKILEQLVFRPKGSILMKVLGKNIKKNLNIKPQIQTIQQDSRTSNQIEKLPQLKQSHKSSINILTRRKKKQKIINRKGSMNHQNSLKKQVQLNGWTIQQFIN